MEIFKNELELIKDEKLRTFTDFYLSNRVPSYWRFCFGKVPSAV